MLIISIIILVAAITTATVIESVQYAVYGPSKFNADLDLSGYRLNSLDNEMLIAPGSGGKYIAKCGGILSKWYYSDNTDKLFSIIRGSTLHDKIEKKYKEVLDAEQNTLSL